MNASALDKDLVARRLDQAMTEKPMGVRKLAGAIKGQLPKDSRGTSPTTIQAYRSGEVAWPRLDVLETAAAVLGRRPEWLIWGEGAP